MHLSWPTLAEASVDNAVAMVRAQTWNPFSWIEVVCLPNRFAFDDTEPFLEKKKKLVSLICSCLYSSWWSYFFLSFFLKPGLFNLEFNSRVEVHLSQVLSIAHKKKRRKPCHDISLALSTFLIISHMLSQSRIDFPIFQKDTRVDNRPND